MSPATTAEVMMEAMIKIAREKAAAGNYPEAIQTITTFIGSIEDNEAHVRKTFGQNLVPLYCLRAQLHWEAGAQSGNAAVPGSIAAVPGGIAAVPGGIAAGMELARQDVRQAEAALDEFFTGLDAAQVESIKASIHAVLSADEKLRADGLSAVLQLKTTALASAGKASRPAARSQERLGEGAATVGAHVLLFFIGTALWGIVVALAYGASLMANSSSPLIWVLVIPALVLLFISIDLATRGWDWLADRGVYGERLKVVILILLLPTMIGALPVFYWTGKGALRWYYRKRGW